jgi:hypothetical protein
LAGALVLAALVAPRPVAAQDGAQKNQDVKPRMPPWPRSNNI